jgi:hypothetical protein
VEEAGGMCACGEYRTAQVITSGIAVAMSETTIVLLSPEKHTRGKPFGCEEVERGCECQLKLTCGRSALYRSHLKVERMKSQEISLDVSSLGPARRREFCVEGARTRGISAKL